MTYRHLVPSSTPTPRSVGPATRPALSIPLPPWSHQPDTGRSHKSSLTTTPAIATVALRASDWPWGAKLWRRRAFRARTLSAGTVSHEANAVRVGPQLFGPRRDSPASRVLAYATANAGGPAAPNWVIGAETRTRNLPDDQTDEGAQYRHVGAVEAAGTMWFGWVAPSLEAS